MRGCVLHRRRFLGRAERAFLQQHGIGNADLADVVHRRRDFEHVHGLGAKAEVLADQRRVLGHPHQVIAGGLVAELAGLRELGQRLELALVDLGDRLVDLVLQHARLVGQHDLVPAQLEQVGAARARLVLVERLDQEVGGAGLERVVADLAVVDDGDHDDRHVDAMRQRAQLLDELDAVELGQLVVGEDDVDAVVARELQRARRRVEQLEVQLAVDLADDLGQQQPAGEQVVDDQDGVALRARERELGDRSRGPVRVTARRHAVACESAMDPSGKQDRAVVSECMHNVLHKRPVVALLRACAHHADSQRIRCRNAGRQCRVAAHRGAGAAEPRYASSRVTAFQRDWIELVGARGFELRPPAPHAGALPGCATPRPNFDYTGCGRVSASGVEQLADLARAPAAASAASSVARRRQRARLAVDGRRSRARPRAARRLRIRAGGARR